MSADDDRAAFVAWIRDDGYLVPDAVTPIEWDDEGLPVYYTLHDGERRYLDGEWHGWQAAIAAEREAAAKVCDKAAAESGAHLDALIAAGAPDAMVEKARAVYEAEDCLAAAIRARGAS